MKKARNRALFKRGKRTLDHLFSKDWVKGCFVMLVFLKIIVFRQN